VFKQLIVISIIILANASILYAVPAAPHIHDLQQPDGSTVSARQWGDEHSHGWETEKGHTIVFDEKLKGWAYAKHDTKGDLITSSVLVDKTAKIPEWVQKRLRPLKSISAKYAPSTSSVGLAASSSLAPAVETTGTKYVPVILINFSDTTFTYNATNFEALLFGDNNSMKAYYLETSYNLLTLSSGPSGVVGPFNALHTHNYYGTDVGGKGNDQYPETLVLEAVQMAKAKGFKFGPYVDQTKTCYVDAVNIVHQGRGQEAGGSTTDIWSHSSSLPTPFDTGESCDLGGTIKVSHYVIQPEKLGTGLTTFGVFAHEYGHALGLPDLYDTTYASEGAGDWTIMAGGSWLGAGGSGYGGDSPAHFDAWSKYFLGWISPAIITGVSPSVPIASASSAAPNFYKIGSGTPSSGEYFLVENRYKSGFDTYLPGSGLLVWHIDGNTISAYIGSNSVNDHRCVSLVPGACPGISTHFGVSVVQADNALHLENKVNSGDGDDPFNFPKIFTDSSSPSSKLWAGTSSWVSVTAISESGSTMYATLSNLAGAVNGSCGSAYKQAFAVPPASNLCMAGTPSAVSGIGPWFWNCTGSNAGATAACMAYFPVIPFPQTFDSVISSALPPGWSTNGAGLWQTNSGTLFPDPYPTSPHVTTSYSPNNLVYFNSYDAAAGVTAYLASPAFSLVGKTAGKVGFWMYHDNQYSTYPDRLDVYVNTSSSLSGASLLGSINRYTGSESWSHHTISIPAAFSGATNFLILNGISGNGNNIHLDDITVYDSALVYPLSFSFSGTGYGSLNSSPSGISCTGTSGSTCGTVNFAGGETVSLTALADVSSAFNSLFNGWATNTTACLGTTPCSVTMNSPINITGTFTRDLLVKNYDTSTTYSTITDAYSKASSGQTILVRDNSSLTPFEEPLIINTSIILKGGYASGFLANGGYTTTKGKITVGSSGNLKVEKIIIR
jgi:M6 family metalloprotease-like protein